MKEELARWLLGLSAIRPLLGSKYDFFNIKSKGNEKRVLFKSTVLPMTKKRAHAVLNGHIFVIVGVRYIFKKRRN